MSATLQQLALDAGGTLLASPEASQQRYLGVSSDTRQLRPGQLYVALRGPNFDGAEFLQQAHDLGAVAALAERGGPEGFPVIQVLDALQGLQRAARHYRARCDLPVVAVAGSNGKTTCKEMLAAILRQRGPTLATRGNLNNHIGVPLTLLHIEPEHMHAVIELGANHPGEVAALASLVAPNIGIVTNAGAEHLEGFGSVEGAARAEGELFAALSSDGLAILNADDTYVDLWRDMTVARVVTFGLGAKADYFAHHVRTHCENGRFVTHFELCTPQGEIAIELGLAGQHNVSNALGAAAAAVAAGATLTHVATGLAQMRAVSGRLQLRQASCGASVIDDSYNANPSSVEAAIDVLASMAGNRWMVFGDMGELGAFTADAHRDIGRYARSHGVSRLFCIGASSELTAQEFGTAAEWFTDIDSLIARLETELGAGTTLLVKGSRMNRLERVVMALCGQTAEGVH
jgi:UDP-N-acetylmuramoyl-tripeptide--D-alanyl-D-alanine ligase